MYHSNSRTFKGLDFFFEKFRDFQGLLKDPMNPVLSIEKEIIVIASS